MRIKQLSTIWLSVALLLGSCQATKETLGITPKPVNDCSTIFSPEDTPGDATGDAIGEDIKRIIKDVPPTQCKVLKVTIDKNVKCEIAGSDKIDNLKKSLNKNKDNQVALIVPLDAIVEGGMFSYEHLLLAYGIEMNLKKYLDSDLFVPIKDFDYKGLSCTTPEKKFTIWTGDKHVFALIEDKKVVAKKGVVVKKSVAKKKK